MKKNRLIITYHGGTGEKDYNLTGSSTEFSVNGKNILIDAGMFQGTYNDDRLNEKLFLDPKRLNIIIGTHPHLDHIGRIPYLVSKGFNGEIYMTKLGKEISLQSWLDTLNIWENKKEILEEKNEKLIKKAHLFFNITRFIEKNNLLKGNNGFSKDKKYKINKQFNKWKSEIEKLEKVKIKSWVDIYKVAINWLNSYNIDSIQDIKERFSEQIFILFTEKDVFKTYSRINSIELDEWINLDGGVSFKFLDSAHIFGSANVYLRFKKYNKGFYRAFIAQDLGRIFDNPWGRKVQLPYLHEPIDYLQIETTYVGRNHEKFDIAKENLIKEIFDSKGHVLIAAFSIDRAQLIKRILLDYINYKFGNNFSRKIYYDGKLMYEVEQVLLKNDFTKFEFLTNKIFNKLELPEFEVKKFLKKMKKTIIISSSGMLQGGAILKYLKTLIQDPKAKVIITGFPGINTVAADLVSGRKHVIIEGKIYLVNAKIVYISGFSSHADNRDLNNFIQTLPKKKNIKIALTHGNENVKKLFAENLKRKYSKSKIFIPKVGDRLYDILS